MKYSKVSSKKAALNQSEDNATVLEEDNNSSRNSSTFERSESFKGSILSKRGSVTNLTGSVISIKDVQREKGQNKDEFDFATDWKRIYVHIYNRLRWLNAYAQINHVAM